MPFFILSRDGSNFSSSGEERDEVLVDEFLLSLFARKLDLGLDLMVDLHRDTRQTRVEVVVIYKQPLDELANRDNSRMVDAWTDFYPNKHSPTPYLHRQGCSVSSMPKGNSDRTRTSRRGTRMLAHSYSLGTQ